AGAGRNNWSNRPNTPIYLCENRFATVFPQGRGVFRECGGAKIAWIFGGRTAARRGGLVFVASRGFFLSLSVFRFTLSAVRFLSLGFPRVFPLVLTGGELPLNRALGGL